VRPVLDDFPGLPTHDPGVTSDPFAVSYDTSCGSSSTAIINYTWDEGTGDNCGLSMTFSSHTFSYSIWATQHSNMDCSWAPLANGDIKFIYDDTFPGAARTRPKR
jgi:hypothetical protein